MLQSAQNGRPTWVKGVAVFVIVLVSFIIIKQVMTEREAEEDSSLLHLNKKVMSAATWNIAAINNNPFEYWITSNDTNYLKLMTSVSQFVDHPSAQQDVLVSQVFNDTKAEELFSIFRELKWKGWNETRTYWYEDYSKRKIISGFLKDDLIGKKRLTSMPDRVTNTINGGGSGENDSKVYYRPTVINCYGKSMPTIDEWWNQWRNFMFRSHIQVHKEGGVGAGGAVSVHPYTLLSPISKAKYPSITTQEAAVSLPLQTLTLAIFDAVLVHMMNTLGGGSGGDVWGGIRSTLCTQLNHKKSARTLEILQSKYSDMEVVFLQEVASSFANTIRRHALGNMYDVHMPVDIDAERDQNSFILLKKGRYVDVKEVTKEVIALLPSGNGSHSKVPLAKGDLLVLLAEDTLDKTSYIFASFHGDTNGLATKPIVSAVHSYAVSVQPKSKLLMGLDANTYSNPESDQQGVMDFVKFVEDRKMGTCYGTTGPFNVTTFNARTHLQPQLNKAVSFADKDKKGDKNPKDFIIFFGPDFTVRAVGRDNTGGGRGAYVDDMVFPSLTFPSDHGVTSAILEENKVKR